MAILEADYFSYAGEKSSDYGIRNIIIGSGLQEEPFLSEQRIKEVKIRGNDKPYYMGIERFPLTFPMSFIFEDNWDESEIRSVARWLSEQTYYQPLFFSNNINRIFYALPVESSQLIHNGLRQGYVTMTWRCDAPWSYSPIYETVHDFSNNTTEGTELIFTNYGDMPCEPELFIYKVGMGDISIVNQSDGSMEFKFSSLADSETVYVHNENQYIETDLPLTYRYENFNNQYLSLYRGVNRLKVYGNCQLKFRYRFRTIQG
ncbi:phage tail domain-containing protein [Ammoniphilus resinae]|uniref:Phage-related protein n=1 Tax=Ammoniphilus resinae TaxID=861532 RepID=A0ABS4GRR7_9BACL|nr:phage tail domain-containing protein [Ammoniphilus resinae]MBP1932946.1 phage-related protein [Ammoniphilus resinae]